MKSGHAVQAKPITEGDTEPAPAESEAQSSAARHVGTLLADRYRVDELLGEGGMGQVFRAEHVHMRKAVAIKVLHRELTMHQEIVARFEREAVAAARIEHPHVAAATDFGQLKDGSCYLVLEFVEGQSLTALIANQGRLATRRALSITRQIADALAAAHSAGIVHRDLKPDNVMLVRRQDTEDFVKVLDFGIAKLESEDSSEQPQLTKAGTVFGTPEYMAPEQAQGASADARADLYTLGMMLYEMLSGSTAFKSTELVVVLTRQMTAEPPPLPQDIEPRVVALVMTLLKKNPDERIQSAHELVERLDELLGTSVASGAAAAPPSEARVSASGPVLARSLSRGFVQVLEPVARRVWPLTRALGQKGATLARQRIRVGQANLPLWLPVTGALGAVLVLGLLLTGSGSAEPRATPGAESALRAQEKKPAPDLSALMLRAERGDRGALAELRPLAQDNADAWLALGRGYAGIKHNAASLGAYATAVELRPALAAESALLRDVRHIAGSPAELESALPLVEKLGAHGADLLYDLWSSFNAEKSTKASAAQVRARLEGDHIRAQASPALAVVLALEAAKGCAAFKEIMPKAAAHADQRSLGKLSPLLHSSGCGFLGLSDCYPCLRGNKDLKQALTRARTQPAPSFGAPP